MIVEIDQDTVNKIWGGLYFIIGWALKVLYTALKELQANDKELTAKIAALELFNSDTYVKRVDFDGKINALFSKLDQMQQQRMDDSNKLNALFGKMDGVYEFVKVNSRGHNGPSE